LRAANASAVSADVPRATYRLQFNREFGFAQAAELVPYLAALGVSHIYASPYFKARAGSAHGYDIVDHNALNPEVGDRAAFDRLCAALRAHGMGQVLDVVPNHVAVLGADNLRWLDVLENGRASAQANFFDIAWDRAPDELRGKLLLPVLGDHYGSVLARGEIALAFDAEHGEFSLRYADHRFPLDPQTYPRVLAAAAERLRPRLRAEEAAIADECDSLGVAFGVLPKATETAAARVSERRRDQAECKRRLAQLCSRSAEALRCIDEERRRLNGRAGDAASFDALHALIGEQVYRLASWRMAADVINYRRFVDVNELAAVRVEDREVFEATHGLLFELIASREVTGVRVDHADGLYDPGQYFSRLQQGAAERWQRAIRDATAAGDAASPAPLYLVIEKVMTPSGRLPASWPIAGTTGYDFAALVNGLFIDGRAEAKLTYGYFAFLRERIDFDEIVYRSKKLIMGVAVASELSALASRLSRIARADRATCDFTYASLRAALAEVVACFPVYRTYVTAEQVSGEDRGFIEAATRAAKRRAVAAETTVFDFIRAALTTDLAQVRPESQREQIVEFAMRFQQFSAAVTAKGMEDTAFYLYNRLVSLNEVGADPRRFATSVAAFHGANADRVEHWPGAMLATSTHDSKRSEDVRARIDVLSELPAEWRLHASRWRRFNRPRRRKRNELEAPTRNDEYLLYQTLVGAWPAGDAGPATLTDFSTRIERYMLKVVREAKAMSSWLNPDEAYEKALIAFVRGILASPGNKRFLEDFVPFQRRVAWFGMLNSLAQTLLKLTAPGVPDIYQGSECWNLSLVDPDNRRAVEYAAHRRSLEAMQGAAAAGSHALASLAVDLLRHMHDGGIKQFVVWRALTLRREREALFRDGAYVPLPTTGAHADHLCTYARVLGQHCAVVVAPRLACTLMRGEPVLPVGPEVWGDARIVLAGLPPQAGWADALTGAPAVVDDGGSGALLASAALQRLPVALLVGHGARRDGQY
jgi:(1->4)-alpha-D-glucan 1-alpha-D-glucosylmutase